MIFDYNESNTILSLVFLMTIFYEKEIYFEYKYLYHFSIIFIIEIELFSYLHTVRII